MAARKSSSSSVPNGLNLYGKKLERHAERFVCPYCTDDPPTLSCKEFEKHCSTRHELNPKTCCVWCRGQKSWASKEKRQHANHLLQCWQRFTLAVSSTPDPLPTPPPTTSCFSDVTPVAFDTTPLAPARDFFGIDFDPPPRAFDIIAPLRLDLRHSLFGDTPPLAMGAACVQKYFELDGDWFHLMIRTVAYRSFVEAMEADRGRSRMLPFSCWCDGGQPEEPRMRQHRHVLVVAVREHFERDVWSRVRPDDDDGTRRNFKCRYLERIASPLHLVNTLGYVCQRRSKCNFHQRETGPERLNH